jgi:hypothetical protein
MWIDREVPAECPPSIGACRLLAADGAVIGAGVFSLKKTAASFIQ